MNAEPVAAADVLRDYVEVWQRIPIGGKAAAAMARELQAYAAATEGVRVTLSRSDQPANFAMVLTAEGPGHR